MTEVATMKSNPLKQVLNYGQSIWYDGLVSLAEFKKMIEEDGIRGATTNPTIFEKALSGQEYDAEIARLSRSSSAEEIYRQLSVKAVQEVADVFLPVFQETSGGDGFVSLEVSPLLAHDTAATIEEARHLHKAVGRPNIMIKVPATPEGIPAIQTLISEGISVNVTLIFSIERYREVMEAYVSGLEKRLAAGNDVSRVASVASFFVSRVDSSVDKQLEEKGLRALTGKAGIANSKAAYDAFEKVFDGLRFAKVKTRGAQIQRPLWASTGTKNPTYSDVLYVEALMGPRTVDTIPPATLVAFRDHGKPGDRLKDGMAEAHRVLEQLKSAGVDLGRVTRDLEKAGVESFSDSYKKIIEGIKAKKK